MKTWLADSAIKEALYLDLFKESDFITDVEILPFESWIQANSDIEISSFSLIEAYRTIRAVQDELTLLKAMIQYPTFIQQVLDFYHTMIDYRIPLDVLPQNTLQEKEMKLLIKALSSIMTSAHSKNEVLEIEHIENVMMHELSIKSYSQYLSVNELKRKGLHLIKQKRIENQRVEFYHALNLRQEIEACAQMIIQRKLKLEDIGIILCNPKEALSSLKQIFDYYQLDYGIVKDTSASKAAEAFILLVNYFKESDLTSFKKLIQCTLFDEIDRFSVLEYIKLFVSELKLEQCADYVQRHIEEMDFFESYEKERLIELESSFEEARIKILEILSSEAAAPIVKAYEVLRKSSLAKDPSERKCLIKIQTLLNSTGTPELDEAELKCVLSEVSKITKDISTYSQGRICISDLSEPIMQRKYCFVLNATSKNYPGSAELSGLFEEEYAAKIPGYPSKVERSSFFNHQREWIFNAAEHLILSYPISTYEGKGLECAFEIKRYAGKDSISWPLMQNDFFQLQKHDLSADTAGKLFVRNQKLRGSISSFERYYRCPYSYFLYSGLKLRALNHLEINQARIGTLQHACIEECIRRYGHNYAEIEKEELSKLVKEQFNALRKCFTLQWQIDNMEKRCIESLWMQFEFLKDMERNTDLTAHQCEVQFKELLFASEDVPIEINGFIDRIDANTNLLRVIDYKSSFKSLSAAKLEAGLQLQLITYLLIAIKKFDRKPAGAYYYSMKNPDIQIEAAKLNLRSFELSENTEEQWYLEWIKAHRLSGKTTDSSMETDNSGTHIVGWNQKGPSKAQLQDFKELETTLMELYQLLKKRLLNGEIDCTPTEGACLFCDYAGICRYSGQLYKRNVTKDELGREREDHA